MMLIASHFWDSFNPDNDANKTYFSLIRNLEYGIYWGREIKGSLWFFSRAARHGHKLSGKLKRLQEQDKELGNIDNLTELVTISRKKFKTNEKLSSNSTELDLLNERKSKKKIKQSSSEFQDVKSETDSRYETCHWNDETTRKNIGCLGNSSSNLKSF